MKETTWFEDRSTKKNHSGNLRGSTLPASTGREGWVEDQPFGPLRFEVRYEGQGWIFARYLIFKIDGSCITSGAPRRTAFRVFLESPRVPRR